MHGAAREWFGLQPAWPQTFLPTENIKPLNTGGSVPSRHKLPQHLISGMQESHHRLVMLKGSPRIVYFNSIILEKMRSIKYSIQ